MLECPSFDSPSLLMNHLILLVSRDWDMKLSCFRGRRCSIIGGLKYTALPLTISLFAQICGENPGSFFPSVVHVE